MLDWLFQTIQYFIDQNKVLVAAHPAEISGTLHIPTENLF